MAHACPFLLPWARHINYLHLPMARHIKPPHFVYGTTYKLPIPAETPQIKTKEYV
nr:MAG TPA: hypothetical protein [Caudoviricetes sp.]